MASADAVEEMQSSADGANESGNGPVQSREAIRAVVDINFDAKCNPFDNGTLTGCGVCGELFTVVESLEDHVTNVHRDVQSPEDGIPERLYACVKCQVHFPDIPQLTAHLKWHADDGIAAGEANVTPTEDLNQSFYSDADLEGLMNQSEDEMSFNSSTANQNVALEIQENSEVTNQQNGSLGTFSDAPLPKETDVDLKTANSNVALEVQEDDVTTRRRDSELSDIVSVTPFVKETGIDSNQANPDLAPDIHHYIKNAKQEPPEKECESVLPTDVPLPPGSVVVKQEQQCNLLLHAVHTGAEEEHAVNRERTVTEFLNPKEMKYTPGMSLSNDALLINNPVKFTVSAPNNEPRPKKRGRGRPRKDGLDLLATPTDSKVCEFCKAKFESREDLLGHKSLLHPVYSFSCDICHEGFRSLYFLDRHRVAEHPDVFRKKEGSLTVKRVDKCRMHRRDNSWAERSWPDRIVGSSPVEDNPHNTPGNPKALFVKQCTSNTQGLIKAKFINKSEVNYHDNCSKADLSVTQNRTFYESHEAASISRDPVTKKCQDGFDKPANDLSEKLPEIAADFVEYEDDKQQQGGSQNRELSYEDFMADIMPSTSTSERRGVKKTRSVEQNASIVDRDESSRRVSIDYSSHESSFEGFTEELEIPDSQSTEVKRRHLLPKKRPVGRPRKNPDKSSIKDESSRRVSIDYSSHESSFEGFTEELETPVSQSTEVKRQDLLPKKRPVGRPRKNSDKSSIIDESSRRVSIDHSSHESSFEGFTEELETPDSQSTEVKRRHLLPKKRPVGRPRKNPDKKSIKVEYGENSRRFNMVYNSHESSFEGFREELETPNAQVTEIERQSLMPEKRPRGRPRKYRLNGLFTMNLARSESKDNTVDSVSNSCFDTSLVKTEKTLTDISPEKSLDVGPVAETPSNIGQEMLADIAPRTTPVIDPAMTNDIESHKTKDIGPVSTPDIGQETSPYIGPETSSQDVGAEIETPSVTTPAIGTEPTSMNVDRLATVKARRRTPPKRYRKIPYAIPNEIIVNVSCKGKDTVVKRRYFKYNCIICEQEYSSLYLLDCHILATHNTENGLRANHRSKWKRCKPCDKAFLGMTCFGAHMRMVHEIDPNPGYLKRRFEVDIGLDAVDSERPEKSEIKSGTQSEIPTIKTEALSDEGMQRQSRRSEIISVKEGVVTVKSPQGQLVDIRVEEDLPPLKSLEMRLEKVKMLNCHLCDRIYLNQRSLQHHVESHSRPSVLEETVPARLANKMSLREWKSRCEWRSRFKCKVCCKDFKKRFHLEEHVWTHLTSLPWLCRFCDRGFRRESQLAKHMDECHLEEQLKASKELGGANVDITARTFQPFKCEICGAEFNRKCAVEAHLLEHLNGALFKCDLCNTVFKDEALLDAHSNVCIHRKRSQIRYGEDDDYDPKKNVEERPYACHICQKRFKRRNHLQEHIWSHSERRPFQCLRCDKSFIRSNQLVTHIRLHHPMETSPAEILRSTKPMVVSGAYSVMQGSQVGDCGFENLNNYPVKLEQPSSNAEVDPEDYDIADAGPYLNDADGILPKLNAGILPEELNVGVQGMQEALTSDPSTSSLCHTKDQRSLIFGYIHNKHSLSSECPFCNVHFREKNHLQEHIWIHLSQKPYNCDFCERSFNRRRAKVLHTANHNHNYQRWYGKVIKKKKVVFACPYCKLHFGTGERFLAHITSHVASLGFVCKYCSKCCVKEREFQKHALTHVSVDGAPLIRGPWGASDELTGECDALHGAIDALHGVSDDPIVEDDASQREIEVPHEAIDEPTGESVDISEYSMSGREEKIRYEYDKETKKLSILTNPVFRQNHADRPFVCKQCGKGFRSKGNLNEHGWVHSSKKQYNCHECGKGFNRRNVYRRHMADHDGIKLSHALHKNRQYSLHDDIQSMIGKPEIHHSAIEVMKELKSFGFWNTTKCFQCKKRFASKSHLQEHIWTHYKQRPYQCQFCSKSFTRINKLQAHHDSVHGKYKKLRLSRPKDVSYRARHPKTTTAASGSRVRPVGRPATLPSSSKRQAAASAASTVAAPSVPIVPQFKCYVCNAIFDKKDDVISHVALHSDPFEDSVDNNNFLKITSVMSTAGRAVEVDSSSTDTSPESLLEQQRLDIYSTHGEHQPGQVLMDDSDVIILSHDQGSRPVIEIDQGIDPIIELDRDDIIIDPVPPIINAHPNWDSGLGVINIDVDEDVSERVDQIYEQPGFSQNRTPSPPPPVIGEPFTVLEFPPSTSPGSVIGQIIIKPEYV